MPNTRIVPTGLLGPGAFTNGAVGLLSYKIDPMVLRALITHNGGEKVAPELFRPSWTSRP